MIAFSGFAKKREQPLIYFDQSETLYIQIMENLGIDEVGRNYRFRNFKETLEGVLAEVDFPMNYEISRTGLFRLRGGEPRLDLTIIKWGDNGFSQIEVRFFASLKRGDVRNKLGVFSYRGSAGIGSSDQITRTYNNVLSKALVKMMGELNGRVSIMEELVEEEIEVDSELSDGFSIGE